MWKRSLLLLLLLLLLSAPLSLAEVVLTDGEWTELNLILAELSRRLEEQAMELEFLKIQLNVSLRIIESLKDSLGELEKSLRQQSKDQKRKVIIWSMASLLAGGLAGVMFA